MMHERRLALLRPFFLIVLYTLSLECSMICTNQFSLLPVRYQLYSMADPKTSRVNSVAELTESCKHISIKNSTFHKELYYSKKFNKRETLFSGPAGDEYLNVFVLDFRMINNDVIYINFLDYEKIFTDSEFGE